MAPPESADPLWIVQEGNPFPGRPRLYVEQAVVLGGRAGWYTLDFVAGGRRGRAHNPQPEPTALGAVREHLRRVIYWSSTDEPYWAEHGFGQLWSGFRLYDAVLDAPRGAAAIGEPADWPEADAARAADPVFRAEIRRRVELLGGGHRTVDENGEIVLQTADLPEIPVLFRELAALFRKLDGRPPPAREDPELPAPPPAPAPP